MIEGGTATLNDVNDTKHSIEGLSRLARLLGYKDPLYQLQNRDGSVVGDFLYFLEDNPGAAEAVINWVLENHAPFADDSEDEE